MKTITQGMLVTLAAVLVAACAGSPEAPSAEQIVEERAQARWDHLAAGQFGDAWEYLTPAFRQSTSRDDYVFDMRQRRVRWTGAEVMGVDCEVDRCEVAVLVSYRPVGGARQFRQMELNRDRSETWIRVGGQWWHINN